MAPSSIPLLANQGQYDLAKEKMEDNRLFSLIKFSLGPFSILNVIICVVFAVLQTLAIFMRRAPHNYECRIDANPAAEVFPHDNHLEALGLGSLCVMFYMVTALVGFSTFYTPNKTLLTSTMILSALSVLISIVTGLVAGLTVMSNSHFTFDNSKLASFSSATNYYDWVYTQYALLITSIVAGVNNMIILVLIVFIASRDSPEELAQPKIKHDPINYKMFQDPFQVIYQPSTRQRARSIERSQSISETIHSNLRKIKKHLKTKIQSTVIRR